MAAFGDACLSNWFVSFILCECWLFAIFDEERAHSHLETLGVPSLSSTVFAGVHGMGCLDRDHLCQQIKSKFNQPLSRFASDNLGFEIPIIVFVVTQMAVSLLVLFG